MKALTICTEILEMLTTGIGVFQALSGRYELAVCALLISLILNVRLLREKG